MKSYIQLKSGLSGYTTFRRLRVLHGTWEPDIEQPKAFEYGLTGAIDYQFGAKRNVWRMVAKVFYSDNALYFNYNQLREFLTAETVAGQTITMRDFDDNQDYIVYFVGQWTPKSQVPVLDGAGSFWLVPLEFRQ